MAGEKEVKVLVDNTTATATTCSGNPSDLTVKALTGGDDGGESVNATSSETRRKSGGGGGRRRGRRQHGVKANGGGDGGGKLDSRGGGGGPPGMSNYYRGSPLSYQSSGYVSEDYNGLVAGQTNGDGLFSPHRPGMRESFGRGEFLSRQFGQLQEFLESDLKANYACPNPSMMAMATPNLQPPSLFNNYNRGNLEHVYDPLAVSSIGFRDTFDGTFGAIGNVTDQFDGGNGFVNWSGGVSDNFKGFEIPSNYNFDLGRFSKKVFVGGLPPDIFEEQIISIFNKFGALDIDWPFKDKTKSYIPPKGYAFLIFKQELSVQKLVEACYRDRDNKLYLCVDSFSVKNKPVQIKPWMLCDAHFVLEAGMPDPRKTVFIGGVPRPIKAVEVAMIMNNLYGGVNYAEIVTDPVYKYPKGAARVAFYNPHSFKAAIGQRFVQFRHNGINKQVEVNPYILGSQFCDECGGRRCGGRCARLYCPHGDCLRYFCDQCWIKTHSQPGKGCHFPLIKEIGDNPGKRRVSSLYF